jgi:hypothetical protein
LQTACEQDQDVPSWSCFQAVCISLLCVQWRTPDDGHRNCLKHVEFHSKYKFEKLVHLVGFIVNKMNCSSVYKVIFMFWISCLEWSETRKWLAYCIWKLSALCYGLNFTVLFYILLCIIF